MGKLALKEPRNEAVPSELEHPPSNIVQQLLMDLGHGEPPGEEAEWPIFFSGEPDSPDDVITVYDTTGIDLGRSNVTGELWANYGIQVRFRGVDQQETWKKADTLRKSMAEDVYQNRVVIDGQPYLVHAFLEIGNVLTVGKETTPQKRSLYTINCLVSVKELAT